MENVREVITEVGNWREVESWLGVPDSKLQEISQQSSTEREKSLALGDYWVSTDRDASWENLARGLYQKREERALAVTKQYLQQQQGECTQLSVMKAPAKVLVQCISLASHQIVFTQTQGIVLKLILMEHLILTRLSFLPTSIFSNSIKLSEWLLYQPLTPEM